MISSIPLSWITDYRSTTFKHKPGTRLASEDEAVDYINQRGFIFFWPVKGAILPSLWGAVAGDRPVADAHDDPGHASWGWKDNLLGKRRCYYGRVLRHRNTFISLDLLPYFYALSPNYGEPAKDYLIEYEEGSLPLETKLVYEALLKFGPLDTITLRKEAHLSSRESDGRFNKALDSLQSTFRVLPVGVSDSGAWHYSFFYDLVPHHFPNLIEQAHPISESEARRRILAVYLNTVGITTIAEAARLFSWSIDDTRRSMEYLVQQGLSFEVSVEKVQDRCYCAYAFLQKYGG
ncbi:MAG TPA: crosslink repair DNA glycosylase YcaQ family protein [Anaerolineaceae bacterium]